MRYKNKTKQNKKLQIVISCQKNAMYIRKNEKQQVQNLYLYRIDTKKKQKKNNMTLFNLPKLSEFSS